MAEAKRDENRVPTLLVVSDADSSTPVVVEGNPTLKTINVSVIEGSAAGTEYTEDAAKSGNAAGGTLMAVRDDQLSTITPAAGDWAPARMSSEGAIWVAIADGSGDPITSFGGGTQYATNAVAPDPATGTAGLMERDDALSTLTPVEGDWVRQRATAEGALWVQDFNSDAILADTANMDTNLGTVAGAVSGSEMQVDVVAALPAGTNAIGKLAANSGVDIGDVDILSIAAGDNNIGNVDIVTVPAPLSTTGGGTEATALRVTLANNSTGLVSVDDNGSSLTVDTTGTAGLEVIQDTAADLNVTEASGSAIKTAVELIDNAVYLDDADWTADTSYHALVGGVTQATPTANTDGDVTPFITNSLRELRTALPENDLVAGSTTHWKKSNRGTLTDDIINSPAAGKRWYLTDIIINVDAACTVTLEDDKTGGDEIVLKLDLAANSGLSHTFTTPLFSGEDQADLLITNSAGNLYYTATGYSI